MIRRSSHPDALPPTTPESVVPAGAPHWVTPELIDLTIRTWQRYYADPLTSEDALAIIQGVGRLFDVLPGGASP